MSAIPKAVVQAVHERAGHYCEACGWPLPTSGGALHHRKLRSALGEHTVVNLMLVHHACHNGATRSIHNRVNRSERLGHIVTAAMNPADIPIIVCPNLLQRDD